MLAKRLILRKPYLALAATLNDMLSSSTFTDSPRAKPMPPTVFDLRKKSMKLLVTQWDGPTNLAKKLGYKGPSYVSQMVSGNRPITEKTAREIETKLEMETGWMDREHNGNRSSARPVNVDTNLVQQVVSTVGVALEESGVKLNPAKFADLVTLVYEEAVKTGGIDEGFIQRVIKLMR